jgi:hypothetical protein
MKMGNSPEKTQPPESPFAKGDLNGITGFIYQERRQK